MSKGHQCYMGCQVCDVCGICVADFVYTWPAHDEICRGCGRFTVLAQPGPITFVGYPDEEDQETI